jgi:hypothetical protein
MGGTTAKVVKKVNSASTGAKNNLNSAANKAKRKANYTAGRVKENAARNAGIAKRQAKWAAQMAKAKLAYKPPKVNIGGTTGDLLKKGKTALGDGAENVKKNLAAGAENIKKNSLAAGMNIQRTSLAGAEKFKSNYMGLAKDAKGLWDQARGKGQGQGVNTATDDTTATAGIGGLNPGKAQENTGKTSKNTFEMGDMSKKSAVKVSGKGKRALRKLTA